MTKEQDAEWNAALLALGRLWRSQIMHYAPEEAHEVNKAIYSLWRGDKPEPQFGEHGQQVNEDPVSDAISAGLVAP